jgi:hypothetical protein
LLADGSFRYFFALRLIDRNRTPSTIAFCDTAPGVRFNFFATAVDDNFAFASARKFFTSSLDHGFDAFFFNSELRTKRARSISRHFHHDRSA